MAEIYSGKVIPDAGPQFKPDDAPEFGRPDSVIEEETCAECGQSPCECDTESKDEQEAEREAVLDSLGHQLASKFQDTERKRIYIEDRWLEDLRQYHGRYDADVEADLNEAESCALFLNVTRPKANAYAARVIDMVLPTDEKNWGMENTPVPELVQSGAVPATASSEAAATVTGPDGQPQPMQTPQGGQVQERDIVKAVKDEAKSRAELMEEEIEDQLTEASYNAIQRQAIDQMAKLGTSVILGPVLTDEWRVSWEPVPQVDPETGEKTGKTDYIRKLVPNVDRRPSVQWVDCWNFYPDMSSPLPEGWEFVFVQYLVNVSLFKKYARRFNFIPERVKRVLEGGTPPQNLGVMRWMQELRNLSESNNFIDNRYRLLRYFGELSDDDLRAVGKDPEELGLDPGQTIRGQVWLCNSVVLKVELSPLDSQDLPFSVCYMDKDEASPFGIGVPRAMRGEQESINSAWRMIHDNSGLSVGPQTVMRSNAITPADGDYHLKPKKMWYASNDTTRINDVFAQFPVDSHQAELANLLQLGIKFADDVTQLPLLMQGDQAPHITQTAQGMSLLYNASTVVLRRTVKMYDDFVTVPMISRFYEWNMQFNPRDDIKGDFRCVARGSSTLLDKEQQGQALDTAMQLAMQPTWQPYTDMVKLYKRALKAKRIEDIVLPEDQIKQNLAEQKQAAAAEAQANAAGKGGQPQPQGPDPAEMAKVEAMKEAAQVKREEIASKERIAIAKMASDEKISLSEASARFAAINIKEDQANKRANQDAQIKLQMGSGIGPTPV